MREALALLTPFGGARPLSPRAVPWFPWVGLLVGAGVGGSWWAAQELWPPGVAAAIAVIVDLALTGMLHVDGLADSADGLLPHLSRERRLEVMADPGVGAFGVAVVGVVLLLRWSALTAMDARPFTVVALWMLGRLMMTFALLFDRPARTDGMGALVHGGKATTWIVWSAVLAWSAISALLAGGPGSVAPFAGALGGVGVLALARRRIGGFTGDVLGAAGLVTETLGLVIAAARW